MKRLAPVFLLAASCAGDEPLTLPQQAQEAEKRGDVGGAVLKYREALRESPEDVGLHREYQDLMRRAKRLDEARAEYREKSDRGAMWAYLYGRMLDGEDLETQMKRALASDPDYTWAHHALALYYTKVDRWQEALRHVEFILARTKQPAETLRISAAICYSNLGQDERAEEQFRRAREEFPRSAGPIFHLGILRFNQKRYSEAAAELEQALKVEPKFFRAYGPLAQAYFASKEFARAADARARAAAVYARHPDPEMARDFQVVLEKHGKWVLGIWEKLAVEIESSIEKGNWVYLARFTREDGRVVIQYSMARTETLAHVLVRSVFEPEGRRHLEPVHTQPLDHKNDFDTFAKWALRDSEPFRAKH